MSAASPFPDTSPDPFGPAAIARFIKERNSHVPATYMACMHQNPETITVTQDGVPLVGFDKKSFTVADVAPERRWAIGMDGELMLQHLFSDKKVEGILEFFAVLRANGHPNAKFDDNSDPKCENVPAVQNYVLWGVDPDDNTKLREIGYDPTAPPKRKQDRFFDSEGDVVEGSRMEILCSAYANARSRQSMTDSERAEVENHLGVSAGGGDIATKLELLTELMASGDLTTEQYLAKVSALTGKAPSSPEPEAEKPAKSSQVVQMLKSLCDVDCKGKRGKRMHEMNCLKCKAIVASKDETEGDST